MSMEDELVPGDYLGGEVEALKDNTFGVLESDGTVDDKIKRLLNLLPVAFQVVEEARETIARLREELEETQSQNQLLLQQIGEEEG